MKLSDLSNEYLKYMISEYSKTHNNMFSWEFFDELFPNEDEDFKCDALRVLEINGLINNSWADDLPYIVVLNLNAVIEAEQNTKLKKIYKVLKEVRQWI